jgi:hypothetical protein
MLYQAEKNGIAGRTWNHSPNFLASIKGYANFINQVDPAKGKLYTERVNKILAANNFKHQIVFKAKARQAPSKPQALDPNIPGRPSDHNPSGDPGKKQWWKFW